MIGRITVIGMPIARMNWLYVSSARGAHAMMAPVVSSAAAPMLLRSQKPARVSNDLRSSTLTMRCSGIVRMGALTVLTRSRSAPVGATPVSAAVDDVIVVLMPLLQSSRWCQAARAGCLR